MLQHRFVCAIHVEGRKKAKRDHGQCANLEDALALLRPGHVERGWFVQEEVSVYPGKYRVVAVYIPNLEPRAPEEPRPVAYPSSMTECSFGGA